MMIDTLRRTLLMVIFCLSQALVLNHIHLFDCATPLLYVYFVMLFPLGYPRWALLLWSFVMGFSIDIFANTPGVAAASLTAVGMIQPAIFKFFIPRDSADNIKPSMSTIGVTKFVYYTIIIDLVYNFLFFTIEAFNFFNWLLWVECIVGSTVITVILILALESFIKK